MDRHASKEVRDVQQAMHQWCLVSIASFRGQDIPDEVMEELAQNLELALFDLDGPKPTGFA